MLVVSDTTPIISLLKIDKLDLLRDLYEEVVIPEAVFDELTTNSAFVEEAAAVVACPYISKRSVDNMEAVSVLQRVTGLHLGESEAIILALQMQADLVLLDELPGRNAAQSMDLDYMGTIGILSTAYRKGLLEPAEIEACVQMLRDSGRHISEALYKELIDTVKPTSTDKVANEDE